MPNTVPAAGEAMPKTNFALLVMDAQNILSEIGNLNQAIYMAAHALNRDEMNAITTVADVIGKRLNDVEEMLDAARGAGE